MIDSLIFPGLLRAAGLKSSGPPLLRSLLSFSVLRLRLDCYARKSFYACCVVQGVAGTWIVIPCWRSIHSPFVNLIDLFGRSLFTFFCNLVSCLYAGSLGCVREERLFCKDRLGWSTWFVFSCFIAIWVVTGSGFMSPNLCISFFIYYIFLLPDRKSVV